MGSLQNNKYKETVLTTLGSQAQIVHYVIGMYSAIWKSLYESAIQVGLKTGLSTTGFVKSR